MNNAITLTNYVTYKFTINSNLSYILYIYIYIYIYIYNPISKS
ncbi:MAG: hypothetical protein N7Q72_02625 [Spiroplasma sp. Tabriz.8]|nr:hypothetical protein [Spiroplasma sp. Tabriz.8]